MATTRLCRHRVLGFFLFPVLDTLNFVAVSSSSSSSSTPKRTPEKNEQQIYERTRGKLH
jgi:hypothetical protein